MPTKKELESTLTDLIKLLMRYYHPANSGRIHFSSFHRDLGDVLSQIAPDEVESEDEEE